MLVTVRAADPHLRWPVWIQYWVWPLQIGLETQPPKGLAGMPWHLSSLWLALKPATQSLCWWVLFIPASFAGYSMLRIRLEADALIVFDVFKGRKDCHLFKWHSALGKECFWFLECLSEAIIPWLTCLALKCLLTLCSHIGKWRSYFYSSAQVCLLWEFTRVLNFGDEKHQMVGIYIFFCTADIFKINILSPTERMQNLDFISTTGMINSQFVSMAGIRGTGVEKDRDLAHKELLVWCAWEWGYIKANVTTRSVTHGI